VRREFIPKQSGSVPVVSHGEHQPDKFFSMSTESKRLRVAVADDEPLVRQRLNSLLKREPDVAVVADCANGLDMLTAITQHAPDVIFLDINMPGLDGLAVAKQLPADRPPLVVFVTAHQQHALEAFDLQAIDYLLKPYRPERLRQALARVRRVLASEDKMPPGGSLEPTRRNRLIIRSGDRMTVVPAAEVDWIESADNYAVLHVGRSTHILRETLTELEARLANGQFLRISRSVVVNIDRVREIRQDEHGHVMVLAGGEQLSITRAIRDVQARLESG
jgi:two-component system LytT family response regulator